MSWILAKYFLAERVWQGRIHCNSYLNSAFLLPSRAWLAFENNFIEKFRSVWAIPLVKNSVKSDYYYHFFL